MGVLTDFVLTDPLTTKAIGAHLNPDQHTAWLAANGIDHVKMGTLYAILSNTPYNPDFMTNPESFLFVASDESLWIQRVPQDMVVRLEKLTDQEIRAVAAQWAKTEEFDPQYSNWSSEAVEWFVREITAFARMAVAGNQTLLMWISV
jgi:hypothetical protein